MARSLAKKRQNNLERQHKHRNKLREEAQRVADQRQRLLLWSVLSDLQLIPPDRLLPEMMKQD